MLLGSPPDMVHDALSHRTSPFAHPGTQTELTTNYNIYLILLQVLFFVNFLFIKKLLYIRGFFGTISMYVKL